MTSETKAAFDLSENNNGDSHNISAATIIEDGDQVSLDTQKLHQRKNLFFWVKIVCASSYGLFLVSFVLVIFCEKYFTAFLEHKHLAFFLLALLLMPSFLMWGLLRAVYAPESKKDDEDAIKIINAAHPASNVGSNIV